MWESDASQCTVATWFGGSVDIVGICFPAGTAPFADDPTVLRATAGKDFPDGLTEWPMTSAARCL